MDVNHFVDVEAAQADIAVVDSKIGGVWAKFDKRTATSYLCNIVISISVLAGVILIFFLFKENLKAILYWVDAQDPRLVFLLFLLLFVVVSFPVVIGYLVLLLTGGYLLGAVRGLGVVVLSANTGVATAHYTLRALRHRLPLKRLLRGETARALLKVISGPQAFKIVFFARLTPIPFGLQNTIFALSEAGGCGYHLASALGLLPAQALHVYLGSTLRSMHDVLHTPHAASYVLFVVQVCVGGVLLAWVVSRARRELALAVLAARLHTDTTDTDSDTTS